MVYRVVSVANGFSKVQPGSTIGKMNTIEQRLAAVRARITQAENQYGRPSGSVSLLAVSKNHSITDIEALLACGQQRFGESYLQDALPKITALAKNSIEWHFIGPIQSNKTQAIAQHFDWVHSIEREKIARRLSEQRPADLPPLNLCIQVNISGEVNKSGVRPHEAQALAKSIQQLPGLHLRGLMTIPAAETDMEKQRRAFRKLRLLHEQLCNEGLPLDTLSMGMSGDLEAAIAEGATIVRIGTALFGPRGH